MNSAERAWTVTAHECGRIRASEGTTKWLTIHGDLLDCDCHCEPGNRSFHTQVKLLRMPLRLYIIPHERHLLRCWMLIRASWSRRVATLQYTSLEEATSTPMDFDQSPRGAGIWRCPALHISRSFEHQSPDPDQSNTYIEKEIIKIQKKASPETI